MRVGRYWSLLATVSVGAILLALAPSRIGEIVHRTEKKIQQAAVSVEKTVLALPTKQVTQVPSVAKTADPTAGAVLGDQNAAQEAAAALHQAFVVAATNERIRSLGYDPTGLLAAFAAYRRGDLAEGDALSKTSTSGVVRSALDWAALHNPTGRIPLARFTSFAASHADWPSRGWLRGQIEARLTRISDPKLVEGFFEQNPPATMLGRLALARALKTDNHTVEAANLARGIFRDNELPGPIEAKFKPEFGAELTKADYKFRADRLTYKGQIGAALHYATEAGPDEIALVKARQELDADIPVDKALAKVPPNLR